MNHDVSAVLETATNHAEKWTTNENLIRVRCGAKSHYGEDVNGYNSGLTKRNLASLIGLLRGSDVMEVKALIADHSKRELTDLLEEVIIDVGFTDDEGRPLIETSGQSIGPLAPFYTAILAETHDIGLGAAVGHHKDLITNDPRWEGYHDL